ncbi:hypothetical protein [Streptomyces sp. NBC_00557]|uniref:hypothetical protein n=1 Tax=Streptomyces sp. NBC_00557 TaxID=2975776 RepID=UPI002E820784|nr:hypothetical protein [Streptomyces sp. NBC_00557]WUC33956.1 hypothetical protein OG956_06940 [Streptomyces sp. NBC_00557]
MLSHAFEQGVLVITVHDDPGAGGRASLLARISDLIQAFRPASVVIVLDEPAARASIAGVILRVQRLCSRLGLLMSVATHNAPARHRLEAAADESGTSLVIHARIDAAIAGAAALSMAA